jgi:hypothetical protein
MVYSISGYIVANVLAPKYMVLNNRGAAGGQSEGHATPRAPGATDVSTCEHC